MQTANDVKLRHRLAVPAGRGLPRLLERHGVGPSCVFLTAKGTQPAGRDADIGRIDMPVHVEIGDIAVHSLAHQVGQPADTQNVPRAIQCDAIVEAEALFRHHFVGDWQQPRVIGLKAMALRGKLGQAHLSLRINPTPTRIAARASPEESNFETHNMTSLAGLRHLVKSTRDKLVDEAHKAIAWRISFHRIGLDNRGSVRFGVVNRRMNDLGGQPLAAMLALNEETCQ